MYDFHQIKVYEFSIFGKILRIFENFFLKLFSKKFVKNETLWLIYQHSSKLFLLFDTKWSCLLGDLTICEINLCENYFYSKRLRETI